MLAEPVLVLDNSYRAVTANPAFYDAMRISPNELEGQSVSALVEGQSGPSHLRAVLESILAYEGEVERVEVELVTPAGARTVLSVSARRIADFENRNQMILVELRDITGEQETARRLEEMNEALVRRGAELERINADLESFNRWISHDLRTPLRFTNTVAHRLLNEHQGELPAAAEESMRMILDSTREMGKLIENLLAFAQLDRTPITKRRIDMARLARETVAELEDDRPGNAAAFVIEKLPSCRADRALMKQVLLNLFGNALKFTESRERPEIRVGFTQDDPVTTYFVRDNGVGFEPSEADLIFSPTHSQRTGHPLQGARVGLTLVKRIIERHGGRIWAQGKPGEGATFYFQVGE